MNISTQKSELIKWINSLEDTSVLNKIERIKSELSLDFEKEWNKGVSIDDARKNSKEFINSLDWKK